jgi:predicted nuclease with TOPRIM domain
MSSVKSSNIPNTDFVPLSDSEYEKLDLLRKENSNLRAKIKDLEHEIEEKDDEIIEKSKTISNLNNIIEQLTSENKKLRYRIGKLESGVKKLLEEREEDDRRREYENLQCAIQDINNDEKLEGSFKYLKKFRRGRNGIAHYIDEDDSTEVRKYKKRIIRDRLIEAQRNTKLKLKFKLYPTLLVDIINHLTPYASEDGSNLSEDDKIRADEWFD